MTSPETLGRALAAAPDPERARVALSRVGEDPRARELLADPAILERAIPILGLSTAVADFLVAHPEETALFADLDPPRPPGPAPEAEADVERLGPEAGLRRFRRRAMARSRRATWPASRSTTWSREVSRGGRGLPGGGAAREAGADDLAVIGMGKLGGAELNYASDVDVLFVHGDAGGDAQERAGKVAAALMRLLSEPDRRGHRPARRRRPAARGPGRGAVRARLAAMLDYYDRHAETWERQALLKVRPVAGDRTLGAPSSRASRRSSIPSTSSRRPSRTSGA